ncbi:hypothetical protein MMC22_006135 [Lobaria immixta]|nr:hypothetical protein [Lobaria immixta]
MLTSQTLPGLKYAHEKAHSKILPDDLIFYDRLYKLFSHRQQAPDEVFWMDTLCIPPGLGKPLRRKAIARMNFTYSGADNVLVIDPTLQSISEQSLSKLQLRLRIACSPWMTRCWTFQEARLARNLNIYLRTTLYTPVVNYRSEINPWNRFFVSRFRQKPFELAKIQLEFEAISFSRKLWPLVDREQDDRHSVSFETEGDSVSELIKTWNQLNERSTTRREDRLLILAVLLDLNAGEIVSLEIREQMRAIFRTQSALPLSFLFEPQTEPAEDNLKCRWIPLYPKGEISTVYGFMKRNRAESHYQFQLSKINALGFLLDAKDSGFSTFFIAQTVPNAFRAWVRIITREDIPTNCTRRATCIILSRKEKLSSNRTA